MADQTLQNLFDTQSLIHMQQHREQVEDAKENDRIKKFIKKHKEDIKEEIAENSKDDQDGKITRFQEPTAFPDFPEDQKTTQRLEDEKKEGFERKMANLDGNYLEQLEKDLADCRLVYASIEYGDGIKLAEIRKGLDKKDFGSNYYTNRNRQDTKSDKTTESLMTKEAREKYHATLERFKAAKIEELKNSTLTGEKKHEMLAELIQLFNHKEAFELYNARTEAKANAKGGGFGAKCWRLMEKTAAAYNKLPLWKKVGLSLAVAGAGALGAVGFVGVKRGLSGVVAGVGVAKGLDALSEASMKRQARKEAEVFIKGLVENEQEQGYNKLNAFLDQKLANVDEQIAVIKKRSLANKFIGAAAGIFLGTGMASKAFGAAFQHFSGTGSNTAEIGKHWSTNAARHFQETPGKNVEHSFEKSLEIKKGSSIEKTLIEHIKKIHPDIKNPGNAAHRMWLDYTHENKNAIIAKVGENEYHKMLKDGMVNVKPGTVLMIDEHDPLKLKLENIDGKISHLNAHHHAIGHYTNNAGSDLSQPEVLQPSPELPTHGSSDGYTPAAEINEGTVRDWNQDSIEHVQGEIARLDKAYENEIGKMFHQGGRHALDRDLSGIDRIDNARKYWKNYLLNFDNMSDAQKYSDLRKDFFDKNVFKFRTLRNITVLNPDGKLNVGALDDVNLSKKSKDLIAAFANSETKPLQGETFEKWTERIVRFAKKNH